MTSFLNGPIRDCVVVREIQNMRSNQFFISLGVSLFFSFGVVIFSVIYSYKRIVFRFSYHLPLGSGEDVSISDELSDY